MYTFTPGYDTDGMRGTIVKENSQFFIPWVLNNFVNKTMRHTNQEMLKNLKFNLEGGLSKRLEKEEEEEDENWDEELGDNEEL